MRGNTLKARHNVHCFVGPATPFPIAASASFDAPSTCRNKRYLGDREYGLVWTVRKTQSSCRMQCDRLVHALGANASGFEILGCVQGPHRRTHHVHMHCGIIRHPRPLYSRMLDGKAGSGITPAFAICQAVLFRSKLFRASTIVKYLYLRQKSCHGVWYGELRIKHTSVLLQYSAEKRCLRDQLIRSPNYFSCGKSISRKDIVKHVGSRPILSPRVIILSLQVSGVQTLQAYEQPSALMTAAPAAYPGRWPL